MINIIAPINPLGYGVAGLNICKHLNKITDVALWPLGQIQVTNQEDYVSIVECIDKNKFWKSDAPCVKIWHQNDMAQFVGSGKRIAFPFFELDKFSDIEKHNLSSVDSVFVTSQWAKSIVESELPTSDVRVIPLGVDSQIFSEKEKEFSDKTVFFNCGKWEIRKGHDVLVELFNQAFEKSDDVELWMMTNNPFLTEEESKEWESLYKNSKLGEKIKILTRVKTHEEVYNIMCQSDCGIFPSRAEGWNLELLEMMSCGRQVITTNFSAHTEFCNQDNSLLVDIKETELAYDGKWFHGKVGSWATIGDSEKECFIEHMRSLHSSKKHNKAGVLTGKQFNWENSAKAIINNV
jgi:glycosyltransferase involved in cell wall biosynthesis